jgi:hypothetical protein
MYLKMFSPWYMAQWTWPTFGICWQNFWPCAGSEWFQKWRHRLVTLQIKRFKMPILPGISITSLWHPIEKAWPQYQRECLASHGWGQHPKPRPPHWLVRP